MADSKRRRLAILRAKQNADGDIVVGDFVRRIGIRGVGIVESADHDHATVAWSKDHRDILPLKFLRRVRQRGDHLDSRGGD